MLGDISIADNIYIVTGYTDMRKSIDGLCAIILKQRKRLILGYTLKLGAYVVPIDNNASERAIRGFCIGKKNWQMIDNINGAKTSAIIYSIVETAKANNLKPYDYIQYILEEIPKHMEDKDRSFLENLLPWFENLPAEIRKSKSGGCE